VEHEGGVGAGGEQAECGAGGGQQEALGQQQAADALWWEAQGEQ
jgi:hypothetical protein